MSYERLDPQEVELLCGHRPVFRKPYPALGEQLWCVGCQTYRRVLNTPITAQEWTWGCQTCKAGRTYPAHRDSGVVARRGARRHLEKAPTHTLSLYRGVELIQTMRPQADLFSSGETVDTAR